MVDLEARQVELVELRLIEPNNRSCLSRRSQPVHAGIPRGGRRCSPRTPCRQAFLHGAASSHRAHDHAHGLREPGRQVVFCGQPHDRAQAVDWVIDALGEQLQQVCSIRPAPGVRAVLGDQACRIGLLGRVVFVDILTVGCLMIANRLGVRQRTVSRAGRPAIEGLVENIQLVGTVFVFRFGPERLGTPRDVLGGVMDLEILVIFEQLLEVIDLCVVAARLPCFASEQFQFVLDLCLCLDRFFRRLVDLLFRRGTIAGVFSNGVGEGTARLQRTRPAWGRRVERSSRPGPRAARTAPPSRAPSLSSRAGSDFGKPPAFPARGPCPAPIA